MANRKPLRKDEVYIHHPRPALSEEAREQQMISLAVDLVERRLIEGTASPTETTHYLKLGSSRHKLEIAKLEEENRLLRAKTESLQSMKHVEELYTQALASMKEYSGKGGDEDDE